MIGIDLEGATVSSAGQLIRSRKLSPVELLRTTLDRIERFDPVLKAFTTISNDYALERAKICENQIMNGEYLGPLHGIPYSLKDVISTTEVPTTYGHPRHQTFRPLKDAKLHSVLESAGAVLVGKVYSQIGRGSLPVTCYNPWDTRKSPGTSSSGSGAAVSASMCLLSVGTDTGGSVRHPASNCNLVGMRATFGRISRSGVLAPSWTFDQAGPLTKTVEDNARVLQILSCYDPEDPVSINPETMLDIDGLKEGISGLKVGVPINRWVWDREIEEVESLVRTALSLLEALGAKLVEVDIPLAEESRSTHFKISEPEAAVYWKDQFDDTDLKAWPELHPVIKRGAQQTISAYLEGQRQAALIRQELDGVFREVDVIAMPTGSTVNDDGDAETVILRGKEIQARSRAVYLNGLASLLGTPALSVPCGFAVDKSLPVGLQLIGRKLQESVILRVAYAYEQATDWHLRNPSMSID